MSRSIRKMNISRSRFDNSLEKILNSWKRFYGILNKTTDHIFSLRKFLNIFRNAVELT